MNKYYKICVFYFDKYDIYGDDKVYMNGNKEEIIAEKVFNGYKEIVTDSFIPEKSIIDVEGVRQYDPQLGIYFTKKGITKKIEKKGCVFGVDIKYYRPKKVENLDEVKKYLRCYNVNRFPNMLQNIQIIKSQQQKSKSINDNLETEEKIKKMLKVYKCGKEV